MRSSHGLSPPPTCLAGTAPLRKANVELGLPLARMPRSPPPASHELGRNPYDAEPMDVLAQANLEYCRHDDLNASGHRRVAGPGRSPVRHDWNNHEMNREGVLVRSATPFAMSPGVFPDP